MMRDTTNTYMVSVTVSALVVVGVLVGVVDAFAP